MNIITQEYIMIHAKKAYLKIRNRGIGPGGWKCPCCAPAPGKSRRQWVKTSKQRERAFYAKLIDLELFG